MMATVQQRRLADCVPSQCWRQRHRRRDKRLTAGSGIRTGIVQATRQPASHRHVTTC